MGEATEAAGGAAVTDLADRAEPGGPSRAPAPSRGVPAPSTRPGRRVAYTTLTQITGQLVVAVLGFVTLKLITNGLSGGDYGLYATSFVFATTFSLLADFGVNAVTAREIARRPEAADHIVAHGVGLRITLTAVAVPIVFGIGLLLYPSSPALLHLGIGLLLLTLIFDSGRAVVFGYYTAIARNDVLAIVTTAQQGLYLLLVVVALQLRFGLVGVLSAYLAASIVSTAVVLTMSRRRVQVRPRIDLRMWLRTLRMSLSIGAIQVINMLYLKVDGLLLSVLAGTEAVGVYAIAYAVINGALTLPGFVMSGLLPSLVTADAARARDLVQRAYLAMTVLAALLVALLTTTSDVIVRIISQPRFADAATPLVLLGIAAGLTYVNTVFGYTSAIKNVHQPLIAVSGAGLVVNVLLNLVLIPRYSFTGAAAATVVSEALVLIGVFVTFRVRTGYRIRLLGPLLQALAVIAVAVLAVDLLTSVTRALPDWSRLLLDGCAVLLAAAIVLGLVLLGRRALGLLPARTAN